MPLQEYLVPTFEPVATDGAVVRAPGCRITVLTPRLLRLERSPSGTFEDRPSQLVWFRDQPVPDFQVERTDATVEIETDALRLTYDYGAGEGFTPEALGVELADGTGWQYGDEDTTLGGALRTLDGVDGPAPTGEGLLSRDGWTVVDDTHRLVFGEDGWVQPRDAADGYEDLYFFGYGCDYRACLQDFTAIAGDTPLLPRWALGNWWSRYWAYSQGELRELVAAFEERGIPLSVCVVDMDWHLVDNPHHTGWTGWTWNEELFPDPEGFVDWLHERGLRTTLNLHPAEGVHPHESQYEEFAEDTGTDPASGNPVAFDASDPEFLRGYFEHLIEPMEEDGIDFWWIDWQQFEESPGMAGLDPLWALNHLHTLDRARDGRRPFILSRWAGLGGHRYPVGFSGDTHITWDSLRFQPYLTATSAGVAFGWWSHDIGGHMGGTADPAAFGELYARWTQFGALSPVNRIHTTKSQSVDKRPWTFPREITEALRDTLRFRHRLIPYLYTMAWRDHDGSTPLVRPMYLHHPDADAAYVTAHQYYLGSELVAAPHLCERGDDTNLSRRSVWLPDGEWFDFASGEQYADGWHARYGGLADRPVYAKAGAIVPMDPAADWSGVDTPETLQVVVFPGADNSFALYEDDGTSLDYRDGAYALTPLSQTAGDGSLTFEIGPAEGDHTLLPDERDYALQFRGVVDPDAVAVGGDGQASDVQYCSGDGTLFVELTDVDAAEGATVTLETDGESLVDRGDRTDRHVETLLSQFEMPASAKDRLLTEAWDGERLDWLGEYLQVMTTTQRRAVLETLTGAGMDLLDHDGDERVVLWNPDGRPDVRFQYTAWDGSRIPPEQSGDYEHGTVPAFRTIEFGQEDVDATVAMTYADMVTVTYDDPPADG